ncbi:unnamed protein product, partial [Musa acuminata subsp. burmannicoides]
SKDISNTCVCYGHNICTAHESWLCRKPNLVMCAPIVGLICQIPQFMWNTTNH